MSIGSGSSDGAGGGGGTGWFPGGSCGIASVGGAGTFGSALAGTVAGAGATAGTGPTGGMGSVAGAGAGGGVALVASTGGAMAGVAARSAAADGICLLIITGVDAATADATCSALQLVRRMQPWDWVLEMVEGSGVPWMPTCGFDRPIQTMPTGLFGPGWMVAVAPCGLLSQNSLGL